MAVFLVMLSEQAMLNGGPLVLNGLEGPAAAGFIIPFPSRVDAALTRGREVTFLASLRHPNIVPFVAFAQWHKDGTTSLAMLTELMQRHLGGACLLLGACTSGATLHLRVFRFVGTRARVATAEVVHTTLTRQCADRIEQPMSPGQQLQMALDICDGLNYLHSNRPYAIVHRDIKPQNILVDARDRCKARSADRFCVPPLVAAPFRKRTLESLYLTRD